MTRHAGVMAGRSRRPIYIGKGPANATQGGAVASYPAGIIAGDLLILITQTDQSDSVSTPAAWTLLISETSGECDLRIYYKFHDTGSSVTISWSGDHIVYQVLAFRDVKASAPINASIQSRRSSTSHDVAIPGVTTTVANCLVLAMVAHDTPSNSSQLSSWANGSLTEGTELTDVCSNISWDGGFGVYAGYKLSAGAVGTTTAHLAVAKNHAYACVALAPP